MKKLNSLSLGKGLSRSEMKMVTGGKMAYSTSCTSPGQCQAWEICCGMPGETAYCQPCSCGSKCN